MATAAFCLLPNRAWELLTGLTLGAVAARTVTRPAGQT
jgi:hypothetical protein